MVKMCLIFVSLIVLNSTLIYAEEDYIYPSVCCEIIKNGETVEKNLQCYRLVDKNTNEIYQVYVPFEDYIKSLGYEFEWKDIYWDYDFNEPEEEWGKFDGYFVIENTKYYFKYYLRAGDDFNGTIDVYKYINKKIDNVNIKRLIDVSIDLFGDAGTIIFNDKIYIKQEGIASLLQYEGYLTQINDNVINIKKYSYDNMIQNLKLAVPNIYLFNDKYYDIYNFINLTINTSYNINYNIIKEFPVVLYPQEINEDIAIQLFKRYLYKYLPDVSDIKCIYDENNGWYIVTAKNSNAKAKHEYPKMIIRKFDGVILYRW